MTTLSPSAPGGAHPINWRLQFGGAMTVYLALSVVLGLAYLAHIIGLVGPFAEAWALKASGIVALALYALRGKRRLLALALAASAVGDAALALEPQRQLAGVAAFGLAHVLYVVILVAMIGRDGARPGGWMLAPVLGLHAVVMGFLLAPHLGAMALPVGLYMAVILLMAALAAISRAHWLALAGALLFVVSDTILSVRMFMGALDWAGPLVWAAYVAGQIGLALGLAARRGPLV